MAFGLSGQTVAILAKMSNETFHIAVHCICCSIYVWCLFKIIHGRSK